MTLNFGELLSLFFYTGIIVLMLNTIFQGLFRLFFFIEKDVAVPTTQKYD